MSAFGRFWAASTVSDFGTYVTLLAMQVLVVVDLHASAAEVGMVNAARWLPYLLFGLFAGVLVDRHRRLPVLIWTDAARAVLVDAASYLGSGLTLATLRDRSEPDPGPPERRRLRSELREDVAWVYRHRTLAPMALSSHLWFVFNSLLGTVFVPYALRHLHLGALGLGVAYAGGGAGGVLGSALAARMARRMGVGRAIIAVQWLFPLAWVPVALSPAGPVAWVAVTAGQFLFGFAVGSGRPNEMGYRQSVTPDRLQGRMNATIRSLNWGLVAVGAPLGGLLADRTGYRPTLWIGIAGVAACALWLALSAFRHADERDALVAGAAAEEGAG